MKVYEKKWTQFVPTNINSAWDFFSDPANLQRITPDDMDFKILTNLNGRKMYPGMMIRYKVSPLPFMKTNWVTEITQVDAPHYFIDEQRAGPYTLWHHEHHFQETDEGVLMTDILHYAIPFGFLGNIANKILVEKRIENIFTYRKKIIDELFPTKNHL